jgi:hypothetical protein
MRVVTQPEWTLAYVGNAVYVWFFWRIYCIRVRYSENCKWVRNIENCDVYLLRKQLVVYIVFVYAKLNCTGYLFEIQQVDSIVSANLDAVVFGCHKFAGNNHIFEL